MSNKEISETNEAATTGGRASDAFDRDALYSDMSKTHLQTDDPLTPTEAQSDWAQVPGLAPNDGSNYDHPMQADGMPTINNDGSTTTHYKGELEDGYLDDTSVTGEVTRDANGNFKSAKMEYDPAKEIQIHGGPGQGMVRMKDVKSIEINKNADGSYTMKVDPPQVAPFFGGQGFNRVEFDRYGKYKYTSDQATHAAGD